MSTNNHQGLAGKGLKVLPMSLMNINLQPLLVIRLHHIQSLTQLLTKCLQVLIRSSHLTLSDILNGMHLVLSSYTVNFFRFVLVTLTRMNSCLSVLFKYSLKFFVWSLYGVGKWQICNTLKQNTDRMGLSPLGTLSQPSLLLIEGDGKCGVA